MTWLRVRRLLAWPAIAAIGAVAAALWFLIAVRPEHGIPGVLQIVAPHLALAALALVPLTLLDRRRAGAIAVAALVVAVGVRFGDDWLSLPPATPAPGSAHLQALTWNLEAEARPAADTVAMLRLVPADVVALQELGPGTAAAIEADATLTARYPYRALVPRGADLLGLGILSRFPIADPTFGVDPALQEATVDLGGGRSLTVLNAHTIHVGVDRAGRRGPPIGLDTAERDADLTVIRDRVEARIAAGRSVVLLGDLNLAASEPAFDRFITGLSEVHRAVGEGPGWTWRPVQLELLGSGLLRIDHVIVSPDIEPLGIAGRCPEIGDHCLVEAGLSIPPGAAG
jgi:endonuclease/exonuclease/phosphatase (EEP) superfamily protein YafD